MNRTKMRYRSHLALCTAVAQNILLVFAHDALSVFTSQRHFTKIEDTDKVCVPRQINYDPL